MAIQFQCPACKQPIEVDDLWASRLVACPYCRNTVTAPSQSTIESPAGPHVARPLDPGLSSGQPEREAWAEAQFGAGPIAGKPLSNPYAPWALGLSCLGVLIGIMVNVVVFSKAAPAFPPDATPEEMQQAVREWQKDLLEKAEQGQLPNWFPGVLVGMVAMLLTWAAGLVLSILAIRLPSRRAMSVFALVASGALPAFVCLGLALGP